jgi:hypothetical protein
VWSPFDLIGVRLEDALIVEIYRHLTHGSQMELCVGVLFDAKATLEMNRAGFAKDAELGTPIESNPVGVLVRANPVEPLGNSRAASAQEQRNRGRREDPHPDCLVQITSSHPFAE